MDHLLDRALGEERASAAIAALFLPSAISRRTSRSRGVSSCERRLLGTRLVRHERLDHLRVDHRAAVCDGADRRDELLDVLDALLQQVRAPGGAAFQERERVARLGVLAQDDDADVRVRLAQALGRLDPFVGAGPEASGCP